MQEDYLDVMVPPMVVLRIGLCLRTLVRWMAAFVATHYFLSLVLLRDVL